MKIIALVPVKNESWAISSYISGIKDVADEIIALDDNSSDDSALKLQKEGVTVINFRPSNDKVFNMSERRQKLLEAGREIGGTHFIWLDADETFSSNFKSVARQLITSLKPGEKMSLRWVHAWKDESHYLNDRLSPFGYIWKDFIECDDKVSNFENKFISESRISNPSGTSFKTDESEGVVIHWQFSRWKTTQYKQALYRCIELIEGSRSAKRINNTYSPTLNRTDLKTSAWPKEWIVGISLPDTNENTSSFANKIFELFEKHGVEKFEPLQIWHIPGLHKLFIDITGREPEVEVFPEWLISLNNVKNKIKRLFNL